MPYIHGGKDFKTTSKGGMQCLYKPTDVQCTLCEFVMDLQHGVSLSMIVLNSRD